ncbi:MAG: hypothetical protein ACOVLE_08175 [Pirellula staleyi]
MICPFCSLLCDATDLNEIDCGLRNKSLNQLAKFRSQLDPSFNESVLDPEMELAASIELLGIAKRVLITGRIASVQTARAAVALAMKLNGTIDCAEAGHIFKNVQAIQRAGINSVSLAEARDHADLLIVIGDDSLFDACPRIPHALHGQNMSRKTVLLLGGFTDKSMKAWQAAGFQPWSISCKLESVPTALLQWSNAMAQSSQDRMTSELFTALENAKYTAVLWSAASLFVEQADLWVERLLEWIASQNKTKRCAALPWTSLDGTFQQVCTWLTGFPGRIRFQDGIPSFDTYAHSYENWLAASRDLDSDSVVIAIDETVATEPFSAKMKFGLDRKFYAIELTAGSVRFPTAVAGAEVAADIFRADQTLLAHLTPSHECDKSRVRPAAYWLARLAP